MTRFLLLLLFPAIASAQGLCTIESTGHITDQRDQECHPRLTDKCLYYSKTSVKTTGATTQDVEDAKIGGKKIMDMMSKLACESGTCGFYVAEVAMTATCDGKPVQDMPGGEYRGLTSAKAMTALKKSNDVIEKVTDQGKLRGDKAKGKGKGKLWGARD